MKMLEYMKNSGWKPRFQQQRSSFSPSSSMQNSIPLRLQCHEFFHAQDKINKDNQAKFKEIDCILGGINDKVIEIGSSNEQILKHTKIMEQQMGQLSQAIQGNKGAIPGNTMSAEQLKAIATLSGKQTEDLEHSTGAMKTRAHRLTPSANWRDGTIGTDQLNESTDQSEKDMDLSGLKKGMETEEHGPATFLDTQLLTKIERVRQHDEQFARFVDIMKELYINIPFVDAIQVPIYAKYIKDMMQYKKSLVSEEVVKATKELMAAINDVALEKKPEPGSPSIKCMIGTRIFDRCLCDLGASVSVMPHHIFTSLNFPKLEPTGMCLELADQSVRFPNGIVEDVPVQIGDRIVPVDFIVLDMDKRMRTPLILGRPFLRTTKASIDVGSGEISFDISGTPYSFKFRPKGEECRAVDEVKRYKAPWKRDIESNWRECMDRSSEVYEP
ncbi:hypothetical protein QOZ80_4BG0357730 [Eleusine coracana subsp. coracana]|nr:hypothetical protein QOZ80_4BG0357730 [Eleusine coracana subsp. coracana]